ncbi:hypothetical protein WJX75_001206 [Coccomyxa subellipsoidea]|uniref:Pkinase-domain-containing protein n=1 Tax=Coccomyxa subellipsoidea TaxID=248742 RepID=A0ABR2YHH2_9CHLO
MGCGCSKAAEQQALAKAKAAELTKPTQQEAVRSVRRDGTQKRPGLAAVAPGSDGTASETRTISGRSSTTSSRQSQENEVLSANTRSNSTKSASEKGSRTTASSHSRHRSHRSRASETQEGSTFSPSHGTAEDDNSDWDRFSEDAETVSDTTVSDSSGHTAMHPVTDGLRRPMEQSLFGVAEKRAPAPFRETTSLKLAKLRGVTFVNQYVVIKYLGKGANGRVFLCLDMCDNRLYAVKIVKKTDVESARGRKRRNPLNDLKREVAIMRTLRHKNIVALQEVVDDPAGNKMLLVMDYMEGGPVLTREGLERGRRIPEPLSLQYFRDMCKALDYLHFNKVVHGDLKPENVLMSARGQVTLSDFGCSKVLGSGNEYLEKCQGTPAFLAPEMMRPHSRYRGRPTDIYALGVCLFTFVYGRIPFSAPTVYQLFQVVQTEPLRFPDEPQVSEDLKDLLSRMLHKNPRERITLPIVMKHPWVTKRGAWPLQTVREMGGCPEEEEEINPQLVSLPDMMSTVNVLDIPRQDHLLEVLRPGLAERVFSDGEYLIRQGDQGTHLLYILEGTVEVLLKLSNPRNDRRSNQGSYGMRGSHDSDGMQSAQQVPEVIGEELPPTLLEGASRSREVMSSLSRGHREYLVAIRREGQFVGEMAAFASAALRCASVRARGSVRAKIIPGELLRSCVERVPEARQQLKEMVWIKSSENMVLEAMYRLSGLHEALEELLRVQAPPSSSQAKDKAPALQPTWPTNLPGSPQSAAGSGQRSSSSGKEPAQPAGPSYSEAGPSNPDAAGPSASSPVYHVQTPVLHEARALPSQPSMGERHVPERTGSVPHIEQKVTPQALEQSSSSGASTAAQQTGTSPAAPDVTPQQSPKHSAAATDPTRVTTPPQTIDRHASVDASSPVSVASADLESSQDIVTDLPVRRSKSAQRTNSGFEDEVGMMATPRIDTEAARAAQSPSIMGPLSTQTTGDFTRGNVRRATQEWQQRRPQNNISMAADSALAAPHGIGIASAVPLPHVVRTKRDVASFAIPTRSFSSG